MNKKLLIIIAIITVPVIALAAFRLLSPEDTWIYNGIEWIKHGNPSSPKPTNVPGVFTNVKTESENIKVTLPKPNETVKSGFMVQGEARVFENQFNWRMTTDSGELLGQGEVIASPLDVGQFGAYEFSVVFPTPKVSSGTLEVFDYSAKDGSEIDKVSIPLKFN